MFIISPHPKTLHNAIFTVAVSTVKVLLKESVQKIVKDSFHIRCHLMQIGQLLTFQNSTTPNRISVISLPEHKEMNVLEDNKKLKTQFDTLNLNSKEFFKIDIGDVVFDGWMIKPVGF